MNFSLLRKKLFIVSLLEAFYVVFMLRYFKTTRSLDSGFILQKLGLNQKYMEHPFQNASEPISMICPFGHLMALFIGAWFLVRFLLPFSNSVIHIVSLVVATLIFIGSWLNFNAVIYLLPIVLLEFTINIYFLVKRY